MLEGSCTFKWRSYYLKHLVWQKVYQISGTTYYVAAHIGFLSHNRSFSNFGPDCVYWTEYSRCQHQIFLQLPMIGVFFQDSRWVKQFLPTFHNLLGKTWVESNFAIQIIHVSIIFCHYHYSLLYLFYLNHGLYFISLTLRFFSLLFIITIFYQNLF